MTRLVEAVNLIQELCHHEEGDLPQVIVVGGFGKGYILTNLVEKSFLQKRTEIKTRFPLVLQLSRSQEVEYAAFLVPRCVEYSLVRQEILPQTENLAGPNKARKTPIVLKLFYPNSANLTSVNRPGLAKEPVGDQPLDIHEKIRLLHMEYVLNPGSIIIAVIPANTDTSSSERLEISTDVDPEGKRTVQEQGSHKVQEMTEVKVNQKLAKWRAELDLLGENLCDLPNIMINLTCKFSTSFCSTIKGNLHNIDSRELIGGARINYIFQNTFVEAIDGIHGLSKITVLRGIQNASGADPARLFPEAAFELLVKSQIRKLLIPCLECVDMVYKELEQIGQLCVFDQELGLKIYPRLQKGIYDVISSLLNDRVATAKEMVTHFVDIQLARINTAHPDFTQTMTDVFTTNNEKKISQNSYKCPAHFTQASKASTTRSDERTQDSDYVLVLKLVKSYFSIVKKTTLDMVPKIIMHFLVNSAMDHLQPQLVIKLYSQSSADLLERSPEVEAERGRLEEDIATLEKNNKIFNSFLKVSLP